MKKIAKRITAAFAAIAIMMISAMTGADVSAAETESAAQAVKNITVGFNLGNALDSNGEWIIKYSPGRPSDYETAWGNPVTTRNFISAVKKAGFNAVRVPVTWYQHIDEKGTIDAAWLDRVNEVVDYVIDNGMYCIIDVHHDAGSEGWLKASEDNYKANSAKFAYIWEQIANRFRNYDEKLMFEAFNEMLDSKASWTSPRESDAFEAINNYNALFVKTVRATGGNNAQRNLMVQTYSADGGQRALSGFVLPEDTAKGHMIVQVHNYDPAGFTYAEASWTTLTDKWGSDADKRNFDDLFARLGRFSDDNDVPVVVGEFAANYKKNDDQRSAYAEYFTSKAAGYGIKCFWWDTGDMSLFDRSACKVTHPDVVKALVNGAKAGNKKKGRTDDRPSNSSKNKNSKSAAKELSVRRSYSNGHLSLEWDRSPGVYGYRIYRYDASEKKYVRIKTVKGTKISLSASKDERYLVYEITKTSGIYTVSARSGIIVV